MQLVLQQQVARQSVTVPLNIAVYHAELENWRDARRDDCYFSSQHSQ